MADGRICDGIGFAQIKPICAAPACRTEGTIPVPNGGSRVLAVTSDRDAALPLLKSVSDLIDYALR